MARYGFAINAMGALLFIVAGGCSLVIDFDRSLLLDSGVDGGVDSGSTVSLSSANEERVELGRDAAVDELEEGD